MYIDLKAFREQKNLIKANIVSVLGVSYFIYNKYEHNNYLPAHDYYKLHTFYPDDIPLPKDFFDYTTLVIKVNLTIYGYNQTDLGKAIKMKQYNVSTLLSTNTSMYDYKTELDELFPVIYRPCIKDNLNNYVCIDAFKLPAMIDLTKK